MELYEEGIEREEFQDKHDITYIPIIQEFGTWGEFCRVAEREKQSGNSLMDY